MITQPSISDSRKLGTRKEFTHVLYKYKSGNGITNTQTLSSFHKGNNLDFTDTQNFDIRNIFKTSKISF